ncbi:MAG TPA: energy transducer TonB [Pyrinomonadaceae bacterium]|nr:energy transducer TonB [Pyrinomonadaceae bacterium]
MKNKKLLRIRPTIRLTLVLVLTVISSSTAALAVRQYKVATLPERTLRKWAKITVMPVFPTESKNRKSQGVAVAEVQIDELGNVSKVEVLEAPDPPIAKALIVAIKQWKFEPGKDDSDGKPIRMQGKLTFYFVIEGQTAQVKNPN